MVRLDVTTADSRNFRLERDSGNSFADDWRPLENTFAAVAPRFSGILVGAGGFSSGQHVTLGLTNRN